jgi:hypothetical protein
MGWGFVFGHYTYLRPIREIYRNDPKYADIMDWSSPKDLNLIDNSFLVYANLKGRWMRIMVEYKGNNEMAFRQVDSPNENDQHHSLTEMLDADGNPDLVPLGSEGSLFLRADTITQLQWKNLVFKREAIMNEEAPWVTLGYEDVDGFHSRDGYGTEYWDNVNEITKRVFLDDWWKSKDGRYLLREALGPLAFGRDYVQKKNIDGLALIVDGEAPVIYTGLSGQTINSKQIRQYKFLAECSRAEDQMRGFMSLENRLADIFSDKEIMRMYGYVSIARNVPLLSHQQSKVLLQIWHRANVYERQLAITEQRDFEFVTLRQVLEGMGDPSNLALWGVTEDMFFDKVKFNGQWYLQTPLKLGLLQTPPKNPSPDAERYTFSEYLTLLQESFGIKYSEVYSSYYVDPDFVRWWNIYDTQVDNINVNSWFYDVIAKKLSKEQVHVLGLDKFLK